MNRTPMASACSRLAVLPVPITRSSRPTASRATARPTPPPTPLTRTVAPAGRPSWSSASTAVVPATGSVAATVADRPAGMRAVFGADSTVVSA